MILPSGVIYFAFLLSTTLFIFLVLMRSEHHDANRPVGCPPADPNDLRNPGECLCGMSTLPDGFHFSAYPSGAHGRDKCGPLDTYFVDEQVTA